jgi:hypothetical protein
MGAYDYKCTVNTCADSARTDRSLCDAHSEEYHNAPYYYQDWIKIKNNSEAVSTRFKSDAERAKQIVLDTIENRIKTSNKQRVIAYKKAVSIIEVWARAEKSCISHQQLAFEMRGCNYSFAELSIDLVSMGEFTLEDGFICWYRSDREQEEHKR